MKLTTGILVLTMTAGAAWAQTPDVIQSTRNTMNTVQQKKTNDINEALAAAPGQTKAAPDAASKPATSTPAASTSAPPAKAATSKTAPSSTAPASGAKSAPPSASTTPGTVSKTTAKKAVPASKPVAVIVPKVPKSKPGKPKAVVDAKANSNADSKSPTKQKKFSSEGKRDPFLSPVVAHTGGSACSTGKKCLEIGQINLRGIVKAETGMIAVVTNSLNKAYFLRENDPVFNGYVVKITGDSITFKETFQDRLGKSLTREVVKKVTTPAV